MRRLQASAIGLVAALGFSGCGSSGSDRTPARSFGTVRSGSQTAPTGLIRTAALAVPTSCEDLLHQMQAFGLSQVGPFGFGNLQPDIMYSRMAGGVATSSVERAPSGAPEAAASNADAQSTAPPDGSFSQTNNQVESVDEPDTTKTDGTTLWTVRGTTLFAIELGDTPRVAQQRTFDSAPSLLRVGTALISLTSIQDANQPSYENRSSDVSYPYQTSSQTKIEVLDPTSLATKDSLLIDGQIQTARTVGDSIRVVVSEPGPHFQFASPEESNQISSLQAADAKNRKIIVNSTLDDWIPASWLRGDRERTCRSFGTPAEFSGLALVGVGGITVEGDRLSLQSMGGLVADPGGVSANATSLYIATARYLPMQVRSDVMPLVLEHESTQVHRFDISSADHITYEASGSVKGHLLNQYSMDEYKDVLRIATTTQQWGTDGSGRNMSQSRVTTLARDGNELVVQGVVDGLGKGETLQSVRFIDDRGYLVTFRQTDPLYVVDLSDPTTPKVTGELKVSGYSEYLHPVGEHRLLGIGPEANESGVTTGYQASLFDVSDPTAPKMLSRVPIGTNGASGSLQYDPHAFLYWPKTGLAVIPVSQFNEGPISAAPCPASQSCRPRLLQTGVLQSVGITVGDTLSTLGEIRYPVVSGTSFGYDDGSIRNVVANGSVYTISSFGVLKSNLNDLAPQYSLHLDGTDQMGTPLISPGDTTGNTPEAVAPEK